MKSDISCIPCYFNQVLSTVKRVTNDMDLQLKAFKKAMEVVSKLSLETSPAENTYYILKAINKTLGDPDPYKREKKKYNRIAMKLYPKLRKFVNSADDPLYTAIKVAVAGNIVDLGILKSFNIFETLNKILKDGFTKDDYVIFKEHLRNPKSILYLLDNAGEIVFDKILIEELAKKHKVVAVVNKGPILNDAVLEDALAVGLDKITKIITTGTDTVGKMLKENCSSEFRQNFMSADLIIAKGHANYEVLENTNYNIFFLLQAKCDVVAKSLGLECGDAVLLHNPNARL